MVVRYATALRARVVSRGPDGPVSAAAPERSRLVAGRKTRSRRRERDRATTRGKSADARWEQAVAHVGNTPESRARWLVVFATREPAQVPETEREAIRWRLAAYLESGRGEDPEATHQLAPAEEGEVRRCHDWLRAGLAQLARGETWVIQLEFMPRYLIGLNPPHAYRRTPVTTNALIPFRDVVLRDSVPVLLKRLRFCARNGCGGAFLARKRQRFCSRRCGQSERTARFRAKHAARIKERRRERYVAAMRKKHGLNVKVGSRSTKRRPSIDRNL